MITDTERIQELIWQDCLDNPVRPVNGQCGHCIQSPGCLWIDVPVGHPAFGKSFRCICRRNSLTKASVLSMLELEANLTPEDAQRFDFDDFNGWQGYEEVIELSRMIANGEAPVGPDNIMRPGLFMSGKNGIGKTTIAAIMFRYWAARGGNVVWTDYTNLIKRIQATYSERHDGATEDEMIGTVKNAAFLVLDDVGAVAQAESKSPRASVNRIEILFQIIHHRAQRHLPTIITTNLDEMQFDLQFERRITSRIFGMCHAVRLLSKVDMRITPRELEL
jgi:DNA replication protein DnaC